MLILIPMGTLTGVNGNDCRRPTRQPVTALSIWYRRLFGRRVGGPSLITIIILLLLLEYCVIPPNKHHVITNYVIAGVIGLMHPVTDSDDRTAVVIVRPLTTLITSVAANVINWKQQPTRDRTIVTIHFHNCLRSHSLQIVIIIIIIVVIILIGECIVLHRINNCSSVLHNARTHTHTRGDDQLDRLSWFVCVNR